MLGGELQCAAVAQRAGSFTLALGWEGNFTLGGVGGGVGGGVWSPSVSAHQLTAGS
ncbi:MAG: hypothetical protein ACPHCN_17570 [Mycobacterium sp.]